MSDEYVVAGEVFATKRAVLARARGILSFGPRSLQGQDERFMRGLVQHHAEAGQKIGAGIAGVEVRRNLIFKHHEFWLTRVDGTETDFSFLKCIRPASPGQNFRLAARSEIQEQVNAAKKRAFDGQKLLTCPVTGEVFNWKGCHIDHEPPDTFAVLVARFFPAPVLVEVTGMVDGSTKHSLKDRELAARWREFHATHARLRAVSVRANLSVIGR